jgi:hypothetical protein
MQLLEEKQNQPGTITPIKPRSVGEIIKMMQDIEIIQAMLVGQAHKYAENIDMQFLLHSEYTNLLAVKQAILWSVGWTDNLLDERVLAYYKREQEPDEPEK